MLSWTQHRNGRQHNRSWTPCNSMCNYDAPIPLNVSRTLENIWESIKEGIKAAKALQAGDIRLYWQGSWKSARCWFKCQSAPFERESDFSWASVFSRRSGSVWAGPEPQIPQRSGRVFWLQWKCKTQIHVCLGAGMGLKWRRGKKKQLKTVSLVSRVSWMLSDSIWFSSAVLTACSPPFVHASLTYFPHYSSICCYFACMRCLFLSSSPCDLSTHRRLWRRLLLSARTNPCAQSAELLHWAPHLSCCFWWWV